MSSPYSQYRGRTKMLIPFLLSARVLIAHGAGAALTLLIAALITVRV